MTGSARRFVVVAPLFALALVVGACSSDDGGGTVDVTLQEFAVAATPSSIGSGEVTFDVTNDGPEDVHEFVIIETDLAPDALPTVADGSVDEEGEGLAVIDEIEDMEVGDTQSLTVDLEAGSYVLICNIYDAEEQEAHYQEGMRTGFTVE